MALPLQCLPLQFVEPVRPRLQHRPPLVEILRMVVGAAYAVFVGVAKLHFDVVAVVALFVEQGGCGMSPAVPGDFFMQAVAHFQPLRRAVADGVARGRVGKHMGQVAGMDAQGFDECERLPG